MSLGNFLGNVFGKIKKINREEAFSSPAYRVVSQENGIADLECLLPVSESELVHLKRNAILRAFEQMRTFFDLCRKGKEVDFLLHEFDRMKDEFTTDYNKINFLTYVSSDEHLIRVAHAASTEMIRASFDLFLSREIYLVLTMLNQRLENGEVCSEAGRKYLADKIENLVQVGFGLSEEEFMQLRQVEQATKMKAFEFEKNKAEDKRFVTCTKEELFGMDERFVASLPQDGEGLYLLANEYPIYVTIQRFCENREVRKKVHELFLSKGYPANKQVLTEVIQMRNFAANLFGYQDYSAMSLSSKMAKTPEKVDAFLSRLASKLKPGLNNEVARLTKSLPKDILLSEDGNLQPWDHLFLETKYIKENVTLTDDKISEYFPVSATLDKILAIFEKLFDVRFVKHEKVAGLWHEDVITLSMLDEAGKLKGVILLDLYARDKKINQTICAPIINGVKNHKKDQIPVVFVLANIKKADVSLFSHFEMKNLFQELSSAMHNLVGVTEYAGQSGSESKIDFLKTPSQMLEEVVWDKSVLKELSCHYKTQEQISDQMLDQLLALRKLNFASNTSRMIRASLFGLRCFGSQFAGAEEIDFKALEKDVAELVPSFLVYQEDSHFYASFSPLMDYASGFYGFLWTSVFAKDLYAKMTEHGLQSDQAKSFVQKLFSAGGSMDEKDLLNLVLQREPSTEAFEKFLQDN